MAAPLRGFCRIPSVGTYGLDGRIGSKSLVCSASGGKRAPREIAVQLPDGSRRVWAMSSQEDLETKLNTHNAGGGVLLDPSTQVVSASIASLQERHLYEVLRLWPRGCCIKGFRIVVSGRYPQYSTEVPHVTEDALRDILNSLELLGLQAMPGAGKEDEQGVIHLSVQSLKDNTTYVGLPAPPKFVVAARVTMLRHKVYVDPHGNEDAVEVDAACIVSLPSKKVAYIAQVEHAATTSNLLATRDKWDTIRQLLPRIPALREDFAECTQAELFVFADALDFEEEPKQVSEGDRRAGRQAATPGPQRTPVPAF